MASSFTRFLDYTKRRTTVGRTPLDEWLARRRGLYSQQTDIRAPGGIRNHNRSRRAPVDLRLRLHGHWDRRSISLVELKLWNWKCNMWVEALDIRAECYQFDNIKINTESACKYFLPLSDLWSKRTSAREKISKTTTPRFRLHIQTILSWWKIIISGNTWDASSSTRQ